MSYGRNITRDELEDWRLLYEAGWSGSQIGRQVGRSATTVTRALKRIGVKLRPSASAFQKTTPTAHLGWDVDWCDECCEVLPLNPRTGWCTACSNLPRRKLPTMNPGLSRTIQA